MISGINGMNNMYGSQSVYNQHRLNQIFQNRYSTSSVSPVSKIPSSSTSGSAMADSLNYLKKYSSTMADVMTSANALRSGNATSSANKLSAYSSDSSVMDASSRYRPFSETSYEVSVSQLATNQVNTSEALNSAAKADADINMQLQIGDKNVSVNVIAAGADGTLKTNSQMLSEAAKQINASDSGLKASVITADGKSSLKVESKTTGTGNSFMVSGSFSEAGKGGMSNVTQSAQNANYTYTEEGVTKSGTSESNRVSLGYGGVEATLKKTGTATVTVGQDPAKLVSGMADLVDSYNNAVTLLSKNADRGSGTTAQLRKLQQAITGTPEHMERLGLSVNKDGTLSLDKQTLTKSLEKEPDLTKDLISGSFGIGQKAFQGAQSAISSSAESLIRNDLATESYEQANSPLSYMNYYSRSGAYTMMNYYATGMMFNTLV